MLPVAVLAPFRGRSPAAHALLLPVGLALTAATYLAAVWILAGPGAVASARPAAVVARRTALAVTGVVSGTAFGLAWTRAVGGPALTPLAAVLTLFSTPYLVALLASGSVPAGVLTHQGGYTLTYALQALGMGLGFVLSFLSVMAFWERRLAERGEAAAWTRAHMPRDLWPEEYR